MFFSGILLNFGHKFLFVLFVTVVRLKYLIQFQTALALYFIKFCLFGYLFYIFLLIFPEICNLLFLLLADKRSFLKLLLCQSKSSISFLGFRSLIITNRQQIVDQSLRLLIQITICLLSSCSRGSSLLLEVDPERLLLLIFLAD